MKKLVSLAVLSAMVVGSAWGASACPVVQPEVMVPVHLENKVFKNVTRVLVKKYPKSHLERFITVAHLLEDLGDDDVDPILVLLNGARSQHFTWLLQAAHPNATPAHRQLPEDLKGPGNIDALVNVFKLANFLNPADQQTYYPKMEILIIVHALAFYMDFKKIC
jgi:hypothetical protein